MYEAQLPRDCLYAAVGKDMLNNCSGMGGPKVEHKSFRQEASDACAHGGFEWKLNYCEFVEKYSDSLHCPQKQRAETIADGNKPQFVNAA